MCKHRFAEDAPVSAAGVTTEIGRELAEIADACDHIADRVFKAGSGSVAARNVSGIADRLRALAASPPAHRTAIERAASLGVTVDGTETPRELLYGLLVDRGMPHPAEVAGALDDLGLTVLPTETEAVVQAARALVALHDDPMLCNTGGPRTAAAIDDIRRALAASPPAHTGETDRVDPDVLGIARRHLTEDGTVDGVARKLLRLIDPMCPSLADKGDSAEMYRDLARQAIRQALATAPVPQNGEAPR